MRVYGPTFAVICLGFLLSGCMEKAVDLVRKTPPMLERAQLIKMAEDGDIEAQYHLGKNYSGNAGSTFYDNGQALYWFCQAGRQGQADALFEIGKLYENTRELVGSEIPVNPARAYAFYKLAENGYHKEAKLSRKSLEPRLNKKQKTEAELLIGLWPDSVCELPSTLKPKPNPERQLDNPKSGPYEKGIHNWSKSGIAD